MKTHPSIPAAIFTGIVFMMSPIPATPEELAPHVCFRVIDANQDGRVDFPEFRAAFPKAEKQGFDQIDSDQDGTLSHDEYHDTLGHGKKTSQEAIDP